MMRGPICESTHDVRLNNSEPSQLPVPAWNLFTREFFSLGKERLRNEGVFVQWLQMYQLDREFEISVGDFS
jgi:spermidine synthase